MASRVDDDKDVKALRERAFQRKLLAVKGGNASAIEDAEYAKIVRAAYAAENFPKAAPVNGVVYEPSVAAMEVQLLEKIPVSDEELRALAMKRAQQVRTYLVDKNQLPENRVLVATSPGEAQPLKARASRVEFSLQ